MKKKSIALILAALAVIMCFALAACGGAGNTDEPSTDAPEATASDLAYIKEKGEMIIGYTEFAPMNYKNDAGEFVGFETDFAKAVCEELGVEAKFQLISWEAKETELAAKTIDCIWNGMTITPERLEAMSISTPYMANKQVLIVKAENADKYLKPEDMDGVKVVAEVESAGEGVAKEDAFFAKAQYTSVADQATALMEVASGVSDACVVDYVLSIGMIGEGTDYEDLVVVDSLAFADEEYGIAFRKDSDTTAAVNEAISALVANGKLQEIAANYKLEKQLIAK
ncbi:MAG: transporter substrate-binding domain-containing protein [Clostridia bacterium]|nr:transporter substrate-binding domain-containing protein [Clostridia bacterium]MBQ5906365.1 transporter substrate-binding domain-containing protein [Clostridia bacterium]